MDARTACSVHLVKGPCVAEAALKDFIDGAHGCFAVRAIGVGFERRSRPSSNAFLRWIGGHVSKNQKHPSVASPVITTLPCAHLKVSAPKEDVETLGLVRVGALAGEHRGANLGSGKGVDVSVIHTQDAAPSSITHLCARMVAQIGEVDLEAACIPPVDHLVRKDMLELLFRMDIVRT